MTTQTNGAAELPEALTDYLEAQDALDNREYMGVYAEPYEKLVRHRNQARVALDAALPQVEALSAAQAGVPADQHTDDAAVDRFATAMKDKLAQARAKGRSGWDDPECSQERLSRMLREHVSKGDPRDVANFCMFLWCRNESIAPYSTSSRDGEEYAAGFLRAKGYLPSLAQAFAAGSAANRVPQPAPSTAPQREFSDVLEIQRLEAESNPADAYMVGLYNGMAMMAANYKGDMDWRPMKVQATNPAPAQPGQEGELAETTDEDLMTIAVVGLNSARFRLAKGDCAGALEVVNKAREACIVAGERASARAARAAPQPATADAVKGGV